MKRIEGYTRGPWKAKGAEILSGGGIVAICPVPQKGGVFGVVGNKELIAAAPETYERCVALEAMLVDAIDIIGFFGNPPKMAQSLRICEFAEKAKKLLEEKS